MGIPKFFRYISERYPLTSELITPQSIPIFDNLYLDMNGIIHNCTHPPSSEGNASFRLTEEQMILAIYAYIDHLFSKIKPRKVFFMAVDGVAPRAKMNQQRSRRFRTAQEAKDLEEKALRKGEELPKEAAFDSNCITPGTPFMARLSKHLQYFVNKKISEDAEWRGVEIILSGHDVPGEGEHKIQEYIRLSKAQTEYNPNTRHCLYGLDADLIMLGLLSHDPHFCLLREEVTFGRKQKKTGLDNQNFYLLHLSLLREYLDLEFESLQSTIPFEYSLEKIIDDFILISVFVGNDFLPHLPDIHINEGAMELIWGIYKRVLPRAGGYLNESGKINVQRLQLVLNELAVFERETFESHYADNNWHKGAGQKKVASFEKARSKGKPVLTKPQKTLFEELKAFVRSHPKPTANDKLVLTRPSFHARDRRALQDMAEDLQLDLAWDEEAVEDQPIVVARFGALTLAGVSDDEDEKEDEVLKLRLAALGFKDGLDGGAKAAVPVKEGDEALERVIRKWDKAKVVEDEDDDAEEQHERKVTEQLEEWKIAYYKDKFEFSFKDGNHQEIKDLAYNYIEGLQWVMYYYYAGVASWGWFYHYHYSPRISDLKDVDKMTFDFDIGKPFHPFEQLMGVLPAASKQHIPPAFQELMYEPNSPILDFYPEKFEADMNGKKQEWEAVVKIPFIEESRLLQAMAARAHRLSDDERSRNAHGAPIRFQYDEESESFFPSTIPGFFPDIINGRCVQDVYELPSLDGLTFVEGLLPGVQLGSSALAGFPSMQTLPHTAQLGYHGVNVHNSDSKNPSMVLSIENTWEGKKLEDIAEQLVGKKTFSGYPFLREGMVVGISDDLFRYERANQGGKSLIIKNPHSMSDLSNVKRKNERIEQYYSKRFGVITGPVDVLLHVLPLKDLKRLDTGAFVKDYEPQGKEIEIALQLAVSEVEFEDERFLERAAPKLEDEFPAGERVFFLGDVLYGSAAQVKGTTASSVAVGLAFFNNDAKEPALYRRVVQSRSAGNYMASYEVARRLGISGLGLSRLTSTLLVETSEGHKTNVGLSLKFESKGLKVLGYSRKLQRGWEFSDTAVKLMQEYKAAFPDVFKSLDLQDNGILKARKFFPHSETPDQDVKSIKKWLESKGVNSFEPVALFAEQLEKDTVQELERLADRLAEQRSQSVIKTATIKGAPRQAILKPAHAQYRLPGQTFALGDRVVMVQESGTNGVPFSMKGAVIGVNTNNIDVVWDTPFLGGNSMGGRCSEYRGSTCGFSACLNISTPQYSVADKHKPPPTLPTGQPIQLQHVAARPNQNYFKPAVRPTGQQATNNFATARNPSRAAPASQGVAFNNVVQGARPQPVPAAVSHQNNLRNTLRGGFQGGAARPPPPFRPPQAFARPPPAGPRGALGQPRGPVGVPPVQGAPAQRGGGPGRGRGRGKGGAVAAAPAI